jgi:hypothetical protein
MLADVTSLAFRLHVLDLGKAVSTSTTAGEHMLSTLLIVILVLILIGALPTWPYSAGWGYFPSGTLGLILIIIIVLALTGRL